MVRVRIPHIEDLVPHDADVVSVQPQVHLGASRESETHLRLDSLDKPEFYAEIDLSLLSETRAITVPGRFSEDWFVGGLVARPRARWLVKGKELEVSSPGGEFVAVLRLHVQYDE